MKAHIKEKDADCCERKGDRKIIRIIVLVFIAVVLILFIFSFVLLRFSLSNHLSKNKIVSLVIKNEELLKAVLEEIAKSQIDIEYISSTQKSRIYNLEYRNLEGLYIMRGDSVYEIISNDIFDNAMKIEGLLSISIRENYVNFYCGGSGFGSASSYYGFYYSENDRIMEDIELTQKGAGWEKREVDGDNWYYIEKIIDNFYYYEEHY